MPEPIVFPTRTAIPNPRPSTRSSLPGAAAARFSLATWISVKLGATMGEDRHALADGANHFLREISHQQRFPICRRAGKQNTIRIDDCRCSAKGDAVVFADA